jgi:hypothetical protein
MIRTISASGVEIRNYANGTDVARCTTNFTPYLNNSAFTNCSSGRVVCNNIFYIKDGKVIEYAPRGRCFTNSSVQPEPRWRRLQPG